MDIEDIESLIEEATVDCYDEEECRIGFLTVLQENIPTPFKATLDGNTITVNKIDGDDRAIKVFIQNGKVVYPVDILDLIVEQNVSGYQWIAAYRKWETGK
ncbi:MAG: calcium-binding protein [Patescibacteria group bacterium]